MIFLSDKLFFNSFIISIAIKDKKILINKLYIDIKRIIDI